jgi:DNA-directed RNA polymerase sigma subunit (sigma70/sigma32)
MTQTSPSMVAFLARQDARAKSRIERDADISQSLKAGATLAELGRKYQITMERCRQIHARLRQRKTVDKFDRESTVKVLVNVVGTLLN